MYQIFALSSTCGISIIWKMFQKVKVAREGEREEEEGEKNLTFSEQKELSSATKYINLWGRK